MTGADTFTHIVTSNVKNSGTARQLSADLDDFQVTSGGCPSFTVDAILAPSFVTFEFTIDASITGNTGVFLDVGDLILRVLFENPPSLTGLEIVEKIREITEVELQWGFFGRTSRIKNWIGFLERNGDIEEDNSSPDWYRTEWSLV